jgi:hypothetical protein
MGKEGAACTYFGSNSRFGKRGAEETAFTVREMRRKASQIAPAYNKGALQYLPSAERDGWRSDKEG